MSQPLGGGQGTAALPVGPLETRFNELLLIQLKRQCWDEADGWHLMLQRNIRVPPNNPIRLIFNFAELGLPEQVAMAIIEAIIQLSLHVGGGVASQSGRSQQAPSPSPTEWVLNLAGNKLTDKVADTMSVMLKSCAYIVRIDLTNNPLTEHGISKINEAAATLIKKPHIVLPRQSQQGGPQQVHTQPPGAGNNRSQNSASSSAPSGGGPAAVGVHGGVNQQPGGRGGAASTTSGGSSSIDITALRRRRDKLFHEEGLDSSEHAVATRDQLRTDGPPKPAQKVAASSNSQASSNSHQSSQPQNPQQRPTSIQSQQQGTKQPAQPQSAKQNPQPQPVGTKPVSGRPNNFDVESSSSSEDEEETTVGSPSPANNRAAGGSTTQGGDRSGIAESTINKASTVDEEDDDDRASSLVASTVATETPDQHDYLDVAMNLGPLDKPLTLAGSNLPAEDLLVHERFRNITVLNLAQNGLEYLAALPNTLVRLDVSSNALTSIQGVENCPLLAVLNLRRNPGIKKIEGLEDNLNLTHLFLGRCSVRYVSDIAHLWMLEVLDLSHNRIEKEKDVRPLSMNPVLRHLLLEGNPFHKTFGKHYRPLLRNLCSSLLILDTTRLTYSRTSDQASRLDRSMGNLMLPQATHGVTGAPTGYAAPGKVNHSMSAIRHHEEEKERSVLKATTTKKRRLTREQVVQHLQRQNQSIVERAVVERLQGIQQHQSGTTSTNNNTDDSVVVVRQHQDPHISASRPSSSGSAHDPLGHTAKPLDGEKNIFDTDDDIFRGPSAATSYAANSRSASQMNYQQNGPRAAPRMAMSDAFEGGTGANSQQQRRSSFDASEIFLRNVLTSGNSQQSSNTLNHHHGQGGDGVMSPIPFGSAGMGQQSDVWATPQQAELSLVSSMNPVSASASGRQNTPPSSLSEANSPTQGKNHQVSVAANRSHVKQGENAKKSGNQANSPHRQEQPKPYPLLAGSKQTRGGAGGRTATSSPPKNIGAQRGSSTQRHNLVSPSHYDSPDGGEEGKQVRFSPVQYREEADDRRSAGQAAAEAVLLWEQQLSDDLSSARVALKTLLVVLEATGSPQKNSLTAGSPEHTAASQQQRCLSIVKSSGLMSDTELPESVVKHYQFTEEELNRPPSSSSSATIHDLRSPQALRSRVAEKRDVVLRNVQALGEAKTCLRYLVALVDNNRWDLVERYVDQLRNTSELI